MKRRKARRVYLRPKHLLYALLFVGVVLIYISYRYKDSFAPVKTWVGDLVTPMQKGINTIGTYLTEQIELMDSKAELQAENEALKAEIESLKIQNSILVSDGYELAALRELYEVGQKYSDYPMIAASVIAKDSNGYYSVFTIDKGSEDGIAKDMNVIAGNGLVGIVTEVGKRYAKVRSIIDDVSYVSGMFLKTNDTCDVKGDLELLEDGYIRVESIRLNAEVEENYEIVTSHISDKYLPGILIGYVSNIEMDSSNMARTAYLMPVVDFEHLENVLVITELKKTMDE
ncbi:MAG: rod shape-determining protein MreC [Lachnospiraceae bacterium]|nr:rod shape-determining protein MreC [Lachnospiraceae bacterium]